MECQNECDVCTVVNGQQSTELTIITVRYSVIKLFPCLHDFSNSEMKQNWSASYSRVVH